MNLNLGNSYEKINRERKAQRLIQVYWLVQITLLVTLIQRLVLNQWHYIYVIPVVCSLLVPVYYFAKAHKFRYSVGILLSVLSCFIGYIMWNYGGVRDESVLGMLSILMFAAIAGYFRIFLALLISMVSYIFFIGYLETYGLKRFDYTGSGLDSAFVIAIAIIATAYLIWLLASDLHQTLERLYDENNKVRRSETAIAELTHYDQLTNQPNLIYAQNQFDVLTKTVGEHQLALVILDLDSFKSINELIGHNLANEILIRVAKRLKRTIKTTDVLARQGGDEFLIIFDKITSNQDVRDRMGDLLSSFEKPFKLNDSEIHLTCSLGAAIWPFDGDNFETLHRKADIAMYHAKNSGRNNCMLYDLPMNYEVDRNVRLINDLKMAIKEQQFELYYQPKIDLTSNQIVACEALIRWNHPSLGLLEPNEFIPIAESIGVIVEIDSWVLMEACKQCYSWNKQRDDKIAVSINVSAFLFKQTNIVDKVRRALELTELDASLVELEITEALLMSDVLNLNQVVEQLKVIGVKLAIDDFGTGYANLSFIKTFDIDTIKIDKSFLAEINSELTDKSIVKSVIELANALGIRTVAEGVESDSAAKIIKDFGCEQGQGYLWEQPCSFNDFIKILTNNNHHDANKISNQ